ncbi:hypothetical protein LguiA_030119 [Lonicera macranthoides]
MEPGTICSFAFCFFEFAEALLVIFCMVDLDCFHLFFYARYATLGLKSAWGLLLAIVDAAVLVGRIASVPNLSMVETVDDEKIANHLDQVVGNIGRKPLKVLVRVNTTGETCK